MLQNFLLLLLQLDDTTLTSSYPKNSGTIMNEYYLYIIEKFHHEVEVRITRLSILCTLMEINLLPSLSSSLRGTSSGNEETLCKHLLGGVWCLQKPPEYKMACPPQCPPLPSWLASGTLVAGAPFRRPRPPGCFRGLSE